MTKRVRKSCRGRFRWIDREKRGKEREQEIERKRDIEREEERGREREIERERERDR